jgi:hypothetical protein
MYTIVSIVSKPHYLVIKLLLFKIIVIYLIRMNNLYYTLHTNKTKHVYQMLETQMFDRKTYIILNSEGKECITVNVKNKGKELYLSMIKFNPSCSILEESVRGNSTVSMVRAMLKFLTHKETFDVISFVDTSTFDCAIQSDKSNNNHINNTNSLINSNNNSFTFNVEDEEFAIPIPLAHHNISIYGKTWYERHFSAYISDADIQKSVIKAVSNLESIVESDAKFTRFHNTIKRVIQSTESKQFTTVLQKVIELLHASVKKYTWMELFVSIFSSSGYIQKTYGDNFPCTLYYTFDAAINELFEIPFECESLPMEISKSIIETYPDQITFEVTSSPVYTKSWDGGKLRRLPKHITMPKHYTMRSLKRRNSKKVQ